MSAHQITPCLHTRQFTPLVHPGSPREYCRRFTSGQEIGRQRPRFSPSPRLAVGRTADTRSQGDISMAIDFTLTPTQRELQLEARTFAKDVLAGATAAELLATPEERFLATRPTYEAMVAAGYLRKCIPAPAGGDNAGLVDMAIMAEEFYAVNPSVTLTMLGTVLGLLPVLLGGTPDQCKRLLAPFLKTRGAPLAAFCSSEPGGSANAASPPPGEGVRTMATREGESWVINGRKKWVSSATGWDRKGADVLCVVCRTDVNAPPEKAISVIVVERPAPGIVFERAIDSV